MANNKVTFYSVPGPNHSPGIIQTGINGGWLYALKNMEFLSSLNPEVHFTIILGHLVEFGDIPELPEFDNIEFEIFETTIENLNLKYPRNPSSQHGAILNYLFEKHHPKTKFFGVIDPDCYVVQFNGIRNLMSYLDESELSMIGASYPSTWDKAYYWDFPTAYFQLMNSEKILVSDLDFRPDETTYVELQKDPTKTVLPLSWIAKLILRLPGKWARRLYRILWKFSRRNNSFSIFVRHYQLNKPFRNSQLFRDTGWKNREIFKNHKVEVMPHSVTRKKFHFKFNVESYLKPNQDVVDSKLDPRWHFLTNGVHENRSIGNQLFYFRFLNRILHSKYIGGDVHPATSLVMVDNTLLDTLHLLGNWGNMQLGFEYQWKDRPFCYHLGHGGKQDPDQDMDRLDRLKKYILRKQKYVE